MENEPTEGRFNIRFGGKGIQKKKLPGKTFKNSGGLIYHTFKRRSGCNQQIDDKRLLQKQLFDLANRYQSISILASNEDEDEEFFNYKRSQLRQIYYKAIDLLRNFEKMSEEDKKHYSDVFDADKVISHLKEILEACRTGQF